MCDRVDEGERKKVRYCVTCSKALPVHTGPGRERHVCSDACWQKLSRRRQRLAALGFLSSRSCIWGGCRNMRQPMPGRLT